MSVCSREESESKEAKKPQKTPPPESWKATKPENNEKVVKRRKASFALEFLAVALPMEKESKILNIKL